MYMEYARGSFPSATDIAWRLDYDIPTNKIMELNKYVEEQCKDIVAEHKSFTAMWLIYPKYVAVYGPKDIKRVTRAVSEFCTIHDIGFNDYTPMWDDKVD